ncbi:DUF3592 domain-containing protein [Planctomycetota bacterium]
MALRRLKFSPGSNRRRGDNKPARVGGKLGGTLFFGVFALVGIGVLIPMFILPVAHILDARDWPAVSCRIVSSEVRSHEGDDSTTYSVHILYTYEINGETYKSDRYSFMGGSSSGYQGKRRIVDQYPAGYQTQCWVNPENPLEAVLLRGFSPMMWFGLIPGVFLLVGVGGMVGVIRGHRKMTKPRTQADWLPETRIADPPSENIYADNLTVEAGPVRLKPDGSRFGKFIGLLFFTVIWDGVVTFMIMTRLPDGPTGPVPLFMVLIFGFFGVLATLALAYQFLALFNPRLHLQLSAAQVSLGDSLQVDWQVIGRTERLRQLSLTFVGREIAQYRRGTRTYTAQRTFHKAELVTITDPLAMGQGCVTLPVPADSMHSFQADHNRIVWSLTAHGDVPRWPDVKETFDVTVIPMRSDRIAQQPSAPENEVAWAIPVNETPGS